MRPVREVSRAAVESHEVAGFGVTLLRDASSAYVTNPGQWVRAVGPIAEIPGRTVTAKKHVRAFLWARTNEEGPLSDEVWEQGVLWTLYDEEDQVTRIGLGVFDEGPLSPEEGFRIAQASAEVNT